MDPEVKELLEEIFRRGKEIEGFVMGLDFDGYRKDSKTRLAVERSFEIIGESLNRLRKIDASLLDEIRDHRSIISFRNILAHAYDSVEDRIVWGIICSDLPALIEDVERIK